jgi:Arc/MetJ-type ribon-helix-helix transcriptional regulator
MERHPASNPAGPAKTVAGTNVLAAASRTGSHVVMAAGPVEANTMSEVLPTDLQGYVRQKVDSGAFSSEQEFAAAAIRLYCDLESRHELLRADVQAAIDQSDRATASPCPRC